MRVQSGQWKDLEYALSEAQKVMRELGYEEVPSQKVLGQQGYSALAGAIAAYHGGFPAFRRLVNEKLGRESESKKLERLLEKYLGEQNGQRKT